MAKQRIVEVRVLKNGQKMRMPERAAKLLESQKVVVLLDEVKGTEEKYTPKVVALDSANTPFDPDIHVTKEDGTPVKTKTGKFRRKPGTK